MFIMMTPDEFEHEKELQRSALEALKTKIQAIESKSNSIECELVNATLKIGRLTKERDELLLCVKSAATRDEKYQQTVDDLTKREQVMIVTIRNLETEISKLRKQNAKDKKSKH